MVVIDKIVDLVARFVLGEIYLDGFAPKNKSIDEKVKYNYKSIFPNKNVKKEVEKYIKEI